MTRPYTLFLVVLAALFMFACSDNIGNQSSDKYQNISKDSIVILNKDLVKEENQAIEDFCLRYGWSMETTQTGLRYRIVNNGSGIAASVGSTVTIRYKVKLLTGDLVYQTSNEQPATFTLGKRKVPSGLDEGLQLMKAGGHFIFILPSHLGYGVIGDQERIPERAVLVCDVELLSISPSIK